MNSKKLNKINWPTASFLIGTPLAGLVLTPLYFYLNPWHWGLAALFLGYYVLTTLSITAGYHRLIAHRAYNAHPLLKAFFVFVGGPAAFQGSALEWCSDHRRHHQKVDTDQDPYNINRGFLYAHIGWLMLKGDDQASLSYRQELSRDKMILWQHRYYLPLAIFQSFAVPTLIGLSFGSPFGGLLFGGILRLVLAHHATFFINSLCHVLGKQTYQNENSAKDSLLLSVFTQGEGLHNFHHKFAADYRNGVRWHDWDPTKWFIRTMNYLGLASRLKRTSPEKILKAKLAMEQSALVSRGIPHERLVTMQLRIEEAQLKLRQLGKRYAELKEEWARTQNERLTALKLEYKYAKIELRMALDQWRDLHRYGAVAALRA